MIYDFLLRSHKFSHRDLTNPWWSVQMVYLNYAFTSHSFGTTYESYHSITSFKNNHHTINHPSPAWFGCMPFPVAPITHCVICLVTGPQPLPKQFPKTLRSSDPCLQSQYNLFSLQPFSSCLQHFLDYQSLSLSISPSTMSYRWHVPRK